MSNTDKPDPARGAMYLAKLVAEDEAKRIEALGDDEFVAEMKRDGHDPEGGKSAEELMAEAKTRAAARARTGVAQDRVVSLPRSRRIVWWLAAAAVLGLGAWTWSNGQPEIIARPNDGVSTPHLRAEELRDEAIAKCGQGDFGACGKKLDEAMGIDPGGESEPRVREARGKIEKAGGSGRPDKPAN